MAKLFSFSGVFIWGYKVGWLLVLCSTIFLWRSEAAENKEHGAKPKLPFTVTPSNLSTFWFALVFFAIICCLPTLFPSFFSFQGWKLLLAHVSSEAKLRSAARAEPTGHGHPVGYAVYRATQEELTAIKTENFLTGRMWVYFHIQLCFSSSAHWRAAS